MSKTESMVVGQKELQEYLEKFGEETANGIDKIVGDVGLLIKTDISKSIHAHKSSGNVYTHEILAQMPNGFLVKGKKRNKPHTASAPGFPPNSDSGILANFISVEKPKFGVRVIESYGVAKKYAGWLEWGTRKILPRPVWLPAADRAKPIYKKLVQNYLKKKVKDANG